MCKKYLIRHTKTGKWLQHVSYSGQRHVSFAGVGWENIVAFRWSEAKTPPFFCMSGAKKMARIYSDLTGDTDVEVVPC